MGRWPPRSDTGFVTGESRSAFAGGAVERRPGRHIKEAAFASSKGHRRGWSVMKAVRFGALFIGALALSAFVDGAAAQKTSSAATEAAAMHRQLGGVAR
jgi:hypothetical protein